MMMPCAVAQGLDPAPGAAENPQPTTAAVYSLLLLALHARLVCICFTLLLQVWTAERSTQLGMAVSSMLKGYTTTAAQVITALLKSVTKFTLQVWASSTEALGCAA